MYHEYVYICVDTYIYLHGVSYVSKSYLYICEYVNIYTHTYMYICIHTRHIYIIGTTYPPTLPLSPKGREVILNHHHGQRGVAVGGIYLYINKYIHVSIHLSRYEYIYIYFFTHR